MYKRQPMNREEYTSLVISARPMATTGGSRDQKVAYSVGTSCAAASSAKAGMANRMAKAATAASARRTCFLRDMMRENPFPKMCGQKARFLFCGHLSVQNKKPCPRAPKGVHGSRHMVQRKCKR